MKRFIEKYRGYIYDAKTIILQFSEDVVDNPSYAIKWSDKVFREAAKVEIYTRYCNALEKPDVDLTGFIEYVKNEVLVSAMHPTFSASQTTNLLELYRLSAQSRFLEELEDIVETINKEG